jgi:hypothetical protein
MRTRAATITLSFNDSKSRIDKFGISVKPSVSRVHGQLCPIQIGLIHPLAGKSVVGQFSEPTGLL